VAKWLGAKINAMAKSVWMYANHMTS